MNALTEVEREARVQPAGLFGRLLAVLSARLRGQAGPGPHALRHVETLSLGLKRQVILIECAGERFLVAVAGDSVSSPVPLAPRSAVAPGDRFRACD